MKVIGSALIGILLTSAVFIFLVIPQVKQNWRAQGQTEGVSKANQAVHAVAIEHFSGKAKDCKYVATLGGAKPDGIEIVDCGRYKTLREPVN